MILCINHSTAVIHYYGNSRRNTGDWCFQDGFITFRDIADLYMKHSRGRVLTIISDCHSAGHWVVECAKFLDEEGVRPCGHSATEKGILLKVYAACRTGQDTAKLYYATRGMKVKSDGNVGIWNIKKLSDQQKSFGVDFTNVSSRCGKRKSTWSTDSRVTTDRIRIVHGTSKGRLAWWYILLDDDPEKIEEFRHKTINYSKLIPNMKEYGTILKAGFGEYPPQDVREWMRV